MNGDRFVSLFTGKRGGSYIVVPNFILTFLLNEQANPVNFKRKIEQHAKRLLTHISKLLAKNLEKCNEQIVELMIQDELKEGPIIGERDFDILSTIDEEPAIIEDGADPILEKKEDEGEPREQGTLDLMLNKIKMEIEEGFELEDTQPEKEASKEELLSQIQYLQEHLHGRDELIIKLNEKLENINQTLKEKDQKIKKLMQIIKSLRKYVSY